MQRGGVNPYHHGVWAEEGAKVSSTEMFLISKALRHPAGSHAGAGAHAEVVRAPFQGRHPQPPGPSFIWDRCGSWSRQWLCAWLLVLDRLGLGTAVYRSCLENQLPAVGDLGDQKRSGDHRISLPKKDIVPQEVVGAPLLHK